MHSVTLSHRVPLTLPCLHHVYVYIYCPNVRWAGRALLCLFNCGSNRLRNVERMRPLIYPDGLLVEVWGWASALWEPITCFSWYRWAFSRPLCFFPPRSLQLCLLWMACLIIYRKGKGSSWSNKHVTALYFVFHWEGLVLSQIFEAAIKACICPPEGSQIKEDQKHWSVRYLSKQNYAF